MREISRTQTHPTNRLQCVGNALIHVQIWITAKTSSKDDSIRKPQSLFLVCLVQLHVAMCPDGIKRLVGSSARPWILGCNYRFVRASPFRVVMLVLMNPCVLHGFLWIVDFPYSLKIGLIQAFHHEIACSPFKSSKIPAEIFINGSWVKDEWFRIVFFRYWAEICG